jgi:uncharacterized protein (TIGR03435 family)
MKMRGIVPVIAMALPYVLQGQSSPPPAFEVASIKPSDGRGGIDIRTFPTRFSSNCNLRELVIAAYSVERWQVTGGPAWLDGDLFAIEATTGADLSSDLDRVVVAGRPAPRKMMLMLQTLLAERFNVKVHRETRQDDVFELVVAKGSPKLQTPKDTTRSRVGTSQGSTVPGAATTVTTGESASMEQLAQYLSNRMRRPVLDRTGISGKFDFSFEYAYDDSQAGTASPFLTALQDATGLKLNATKGPVEFLVVDHADKPSAN